MPGITALYPQLPQELMNEIVDCGGDDPEFLRRCRLSCRSLRSQSQKYTFETVNIKEPKRSKDLLEIMRGNVAINGPVGSHIRTIHVTALQLMMSNDPFYELMHHINSSRHLPISLGIFPRTTDKRIPRPLEFSVPTRVLVSSLWYVTTLEITGIYGFPGVIISACSNLKELRIDNTTIALDPSAAIDTPAIPRLHTLGVFATKAISVKHLVDSFVDIRTLKRLEYEVSPDCCEENSVKDLKYMLDVCSYALEELRIASTFSPYAIRGQIYDMRRITNLRKLEFSTIDAFDPECPTHAPTGAYFLCDALRTIGSQHNTLQKVSIFSVIGLREEHIARNMDGTFEAVIFDSESSPLMNQHTAWGAVDRELTRASHGRQLLVEFTTVGTLSDHLVSEDEYKLVKNAFEMGMRIRGRGALPLVGEASHTRLMCGATVELEG